MIEFNQFASFGKNSKNLQPEVIINKGLVIQHRYFYEIIKHFIDNDMGFAWIMYIAHFYHYKSPLFGMFEISGEDFCEGLSNIPIKITDSSELAIKYNLDYKFTSTSIYKNAVDAFVELYVNNDNSISSYLAKRKALNTVNKLLSSNVSVDDATKYKALSQTQNDILVDIENLEKRIFNGKHNEAGRRFLITMANIDSI